MYADQSDDDDYVSDEEKDGDVGVEILWVDTQIDMIDGYDRQRNRSGR